MESYWYAVLHEVMNKNEEDYFFRYTALSEQLTAKHKRLRRQRRRQPEDLPNKYYLGESFPGMYLTQREHDCLLALLRGRTVRQVAAYLDLSPRTVEYYVKNMKGKLNCHSRSELLELALRTELFSHVLTQF